MAPPRIDPNPENASLEEIERTLACTPNKRLYERLFGVRLRLVGMGTETAAQAMNVSPRTIVRWVSAFNRGGIGGLIDQPRPGRPRKIPREITASLRAAVEEPSSVGVTHWTAKKFHGHLRETLNLEVGYSTVTRWLHEQEFRLKVPRPWPDRQDEALRQAFVGRLGEWLADERIELWVSDETGVEGDPRPRRRWALKGSKPTRVKNGDHLRMNVMGAICPRQGTFFAIETTHSDGDTFQAFLDEANRSIRFERARNLFICDNASWHKVKTLGWGRFEPVFLPPYSPDLNPIERLWNLIKAEWFSDYVAKTRDELIARLDLALNWAIGRTEDNRKTCSIKTKL